MSEPICDMCDQPVVREQPWLALNRYIVGCGTGRCMSEAKTVDDEYLWEVGPLEDDDGASQRIFHWPTCFNLWMEGKMAGLRVHFRKLKGEESE